AAEAVEGHRHRNWHVDADHACGDAPGELARRAAVAREDRRSIAELMALDEPERLVESLDPQHDEHRAEDLLAVDSHALGDAVEEHRAHEKAALVARHGELAAVHDQLRAFLDSGLDVAQHALTVLARDEWAHV